MVLGNFGVTLMGYSYMDLMSGFVGTYFYQLVWNALHTCGLTVLPFVAVMVTAIRENYENDELNDEPHQQVGRLMTKLAVMVGIMIFAAAPTIKVTDLAVRMQLRVCDQTTVETSDKAEQAVVTFLTTGLANVALSSVKESLELQESLEYAAEKSTLDRITGQFTMSGEVLRTPIWWYFWRQMMLAVSSMVTAELPCDNGLRALKHELSTNFIKDASLAEDLGAFMAQCTLEARSKHQALINGGALEPEWMLPNNPFYIGSFYGEIRATKPVWGFGLIEEEKGYDPIKAKNSSNPSGTPKGYGYPTCDVWWSDRSLIDSKVDANEPSRKVYRGLEERLFTYFNIKDPEQCGYYKEILSIKLFGDSSPNCTGDGLNESAVLTGILKEQLLGQSKAAFDAQKTLSKHMGAAAQYGSHNETSEGNKWSQTLFSYTMDIGLFTSAFADFSGNLGLLKSMPAATSLLILLITALLPIGMVIGRYEVEPLIGLTVTYCGFFLWIPYFRMVRWLDDHFVTMITGSWQANTVVMFEMMVSVGYVAVPLLLGSVITVAGIRIAQLSPTGGDKMGSIANSGAKQIQNTISSKAKLGAKGK